MKANKLNNIKDIVIAITYRCNSHCRMCDIWQKNNYEQEMPAEDFLNLPENLEDINITGGEPFLRNDLLQIIKNIHQRCAKANVIISTNGFLTNVIIDEMRKIFKIMPDIGIAISIDGIGERHNEIRGVQGTYEKAISALNGLKKIGIKNLKISFTLGDYNALELKKVYRLSRELGVEFSLAVVHSSKSYFNAENEIKNKEEIINVLNWLIREEIRGFDFKKWARAFFAYGACEFVKTGKRILPDYSGKLNVFIDPSGEIYPNNISDYNIGNLYKIEEGLKEAKNVPASWMMCTARQTKRHIFRGAFWFLKYKIIVNSHIQFN